MTKWIVGGYQIADSEKEDDQSGSLPQKQVCQRFTKTVNATRNFGGQDDKGPPKQALQTGKS